MTRYEYRALTPWSFFLPVALAVAVGVLVANALGAALFDDGGEPDPAPAIEAQAAAAAVDTPAEPVDAGQAGNKADTAPAVAGNQARMAPVPDAPSTAEPVRLPGPSSARRSGEARACIGGTIAVRAANGWEQEVVDDAPGRCVAESP